MRPKFELAEVVRRFGKELVQKENLSPIQTKTLFDIVQRRTASLGGHEEACDCCGAIRFSYNSCGNRHCPKCQLARQVKWTDKLIDRTLPVKHYHIVFTVPHCLNNICLWNNRMYYKILFSAVCRTLYSFGYSHYGVESGALAVLHSWGQNLALHPHIHCLVPAGGITQNNKWRNTRAEGKFLFPVKALAKVFRGKLTDGLIKLHKQDKIQLEHPFVENRKYIHPLYKKKWVVYAKLPMHNAEQVVRYIGRYSHRIAISNHRIKSIENDRVKFSAFDYRTSKSVMVDLAADEFLRRFSMHILPPGFVKIRHYGILSSRNKAGAMDCARKSLQTAKSNAGSLPELPSGEWFNAIFGIIPAICPKCKSGYMRLVDVVYPGCRGSPSEGICENLLFAS